MIDPLDAKVKHSSGSRQADHAPRCAPKKSWPTSSWAMKSRAQTARTVPPSGMCVCPSQKRIYGVNIKAEPSTRFADWIETNLLKVETSHIRKIVFDNYKIQEDPNGPGPPDAAARREGRQSRGKTGQARGRWKAWLRTRSWSKTSSAR